jgi:hypothetical protein
VFHDIDLKALEKLRGQMNQAKANGHPTNAPTSYLASRVQKRLEKRVEARRAFEPKIAILEVPHDQWTIDDLVQIYTQLFTEETAGNCSSQCLALLEKGVPLTYTAMSSWESLSIDIEELIANDVPPMSAVDQTTLIGNMVIEMKKQNAEDKAPHHAIWRPRRSSISFDRTRAPDRSSLSSWIFSLCSWKIVSSRQEMSISGSLHQPSKNPPGSRIIS